MAHNPTDSMSLPDVAQTGLLTFYCHVVESQNPHPILVDEKAVQVSRQLAPLLAASPNRMLRNLERGKIKKELVVHINLRAKRYDEYAGSFLKEHPDGMLVNVGSKDSRFQRIDNGRMICLDLDLPEMIELNANFTQRRIDTISFLHQCLIMPGWIRWRALVRARCSSWQKVS